MLRATLRISVWNAHAEIGIMRGLPGEPGNRVSKPDTHSGPADFSAGPEVSASAGDQAGLCPAVCVRFSTLARPPPILSNWTGRRATVANDVLGDMKQLVNRYSSGGRPARV